MGWLVRVVSEVVSEDSMSSNVVIINNSDT